MHSQATLFVDCRCTLGEGILWDEKRRAMTDKRVDRPLQY
jgi:sugar lactone lactonase YvrE